MTTDATAGSLEAESAGYLATVLDFTRALERLRGLDVHRAAAFNVEARSLFRQIRQVDPARAEHEPLALRRELQSLQARLADVTTRVHSAIAEVN